MKCNRRLSDEITTSSLLRGIKKQWDPDFPRNIVKLFNLRNIMSGYPEVLIIQKMEKKYNSFIFKVLCTNIIATDYYY